MSRPPNKYVIAAWPDPGFELVRRLNPFFVVPGTVVWELLILGQKGGSHRLRKRTSIRFSFPEKESVNARIKRTALQGAQGRKGGFIAYPLEGDQRGAVAWILNRLLKRKADYFRNPTEKTELPGLLPKEFEMPMLLGTPIQALLPQSDFKEWLATLEEF